MVSLAEILRRHWPAYRAKLGHALPPAHRAAVTAILSCRTPERGGHLYVCECGAFQFAYHSCGHRACNQCGRADAQAWAQRQESKLLPVPCFLVTFTVPEELREAIRAHARELYTGSSVKAPARWPTWLSPSSALNWASPAHCTLGPANSSRRRQRVKKI